MQGRFCHACGQKAVSAKLSLRDVGHEALHELAHLDGKLLQTARLLVFSPGALTNEFLAGRRARYVSPLRVYLTCSLLFFGVAALFPATAGSIITVRETRSASDPAQAKEPTLQVEEIRHRIVESFVHNMPRGMFLLMPFFAVLTWVFYRRQQPFYVAHLYHAIHFHAFVFLMMAGWILLALGGRYTRVAGSFLTFAIIPYHYISLSRVFGGSVTRTIVKGTIIGMLYWLISGLVVLGLAVLVLKASLPR